MKTALQHRAAQKRENRFAIDALCVDMPFRLDDSLREDEIRVVDTRSGKTVGVITNVALTFPKRMGTLTSEAYYPSEVRSGRERSAE